MSIDRTTLTNSAAVRQACREGSFTDHTAGLAPGFAQANLVILPREHAFDFLQFCRRNPKPCPLLDVTEPGSPLPSTIAPDADIRTDLPRYRIWEHGELVDEPTDISDRWQDDMVGFLIGCSFTFEAALSRAGLPIRHLEQGTNVPMFRTNVACHPAGVFAGPMVVSMRPYAPAEAIRAVQVTSRYPEVHGAPVHIGHPGLIGISDLARPDYGDPVPVADDELPVFWACGVTPQAVLAAADLPLAITHAPGAMFVSDLSDEELGQ
ncbi:MAG: DUF1445 domain-containing protein [Planctomycetaceae bacterium]|jgi:uncharacterized protein YcsI (UPF0317 family)|nr:DUF1445 domain-containing protein [Planctomycetaceae bacterium]